jgi:hypothetical protein
MLEHEFWIVPKSRFIREYGRWRRRILAGEKVYVTRCGRDATLQVYLSESDYERFVDKMGDEFNAWCREKCGTKRRYKVQPGIVTGWGDALRRIESEQALDELARQAQEFDMD